MTKTPAWLNTIMIIGLIIGVVGAAMLGHSAFSEPIAWAMTLGGFVLCVLLPQVYFKLGEDQNERRN